MSTESASEPVLPLLSTPGLCDRIAYAIAAVVIRVQQTSPEALQARFQTVNLAAKQSQLVAKFSSMLNLCQDFAALKKVTNGILQQLLLPQFFETSEYGALLQRIGALASHSQQFFSNGPDQRTLLNQPATGEADAIAVLLLDAENIHLPEAAEDWIAQFCHYPLQTKIAVGNWRNLGSRDQTLHQQGYQMIHVPSGKNGADLKMTAVGASLLLFAPKVKEVVVCSSDGDLDHLKQTLSTQGLKVYQVRQQNSSLVLTNGRPQALSTFPLMKPAAVPSLSAGLEFLKTYLTGVSDAPVLLGVVGAAFRQHFNIPLHQFIVHHGFNQKPKVFLESQPEFLVALTEANQQPCVSLKPPTLPLQPPLESNQEKVNLTPGKLRNISKGILKRLTQEQAADKIAIEYIASQFFQQYGRPLSEVLRQHGMGKSLPKFFESIHGVALEKREGRWLVSFAPQAAS